MARGAGVFRRRLATLREGFVSQLWPTPLLAVVGALALGVGLPIIDQVADAHLPGWLESTVFSGGADAARSLLSAIAGSLMSATTLTFSLTVVTLQLASSQASPRLLRLFSSDPMVHSTLATFLGTFVYSLVVLRTVIDETAHTKEFVPRLSVSLATILTLASVVMLTLFLAHLTRQLRIETMMRDVHRQASSTISLMGDDLSGEPCAVPTEPTVMRIVLSPVSGFLTSVDRAGLIRLAKKQNIVIRELRPVGAGVVKETPIAQWWRADPPPENRMSDEEIDERIVSEYSASYERTAQHDVGYGIRQLADVAARAMSPGVNDPTTAVVAIGHIASVLGELATRSPRPDAYADKEGIPRLVPTGDRFEEFVEVGIQQVRRYGVSDPDVAARLFGLIDDVAWRSYRADQRAILTVQLERLESSVDAADYDGFEREHFAHLASGVRRTLERLPA